MDHESESWLLSEHVCVKEDIEGSLTVVEMPETPVIERPVAELKAAMNALLER
jgi:hypothetical protein